MYSRGLNILSRDRGNPQDTSICLQEFVRLPSCHDRQWSSWIVLKCESRIRRMFRLPEFGWPLLENPMERIREVGSEAHVLYLPAGLWNFLWLQDFCEMIRRMNEEIHGKKITLWSENNCKRTVAFHRLWAVIFLTFSFLHILGSLSNLLTMNDNPHTIKTTHKPGYSKTTAKLIGPWDISLLSSSKSISVGSTAEIHVSALQPTVPLLHSGMTADK